MRIDETLGFTQNVTKAAFSCKTKSLINSLSFQVTFSINSLMILLCGKYYLVNII